MGLYFLQKIYQVDRNYLELSMMQILTQYEYISVRQMALLNVQVLPCKQPVLH